MTLFTAKEKMKCILFYCTFFICNLFILKTSEKNQDNMHLIQVYTVLISYRVLNFNIVEQCISFFKDQIFKIIKIRQYLLRIDRTIKQ